MIKFIYTICLFTYVGAFANQDLLGLSLKELMNVQIKSSSPMGVLQQPAKDLTPDAISIGLMVPFSLEQKSSVEIFAAADIAADEVNQQGGINGKRFRVIRADDGNSEKAGISITHEMIDRFQIKLLIGPHSSDNAVALINSVALPKQLPVFLPAANANHISALKDNDLVYRLTATNQQIAQSAANFIKKNDFKKVAIFYQKDVFGRELEFSMQSALLDSEVEVVHSQALSKMVNYESYNLTPEVQAIHSKQVDVIFAPITANQSRALLDKLLNNWNGPLPTIVFAEHANTTAEKPIKSLNQPLCVFSVIPDFDLDRISVIQGIEKTLSTTQTSYTALFVYDLTILAAAAISHSEIHKIPISESIRFLTQQSGIPLRHDNYDDFLMALKKIKRFQFQGQSGVVNFNNSGDNQNIKLRMAALHNLYGKGCDKQFSYKG